MVSRIFVCAAVAAVLMVSDAFARNGGNSGCRDATAIVPGPNGCNNYGLCRAFFAGSNTGRGHKRAAPPFAQLINVACEACDCDSDDNGTNEPAAEDQCVAMFCPDSNPAGKGKDPSGLDD